MGLLRRESYTVFAGGKHHAEKYDENPIHKYLIDGFMESLVTFVQQTGKTKIFEIGCGEGQLLGVLFNWGCEVAGCDADPEAVEMTNENLRMSSGGGHVFLGNLYDFTPGDSRLAGKMIICCEVLEHVPNPEKGMQIIASCTDEYFIVSVPHEPIWCILNMARGKYWKSFGNTPGHINHWTRGGFVKLVEKYADVVAVNTPLPWTMVLAKTR